MATFHPLRSSDELDALIASSEEGPAVVFLHDESCPISSAAYDEMLDVRADVSLIDVTTDHEVKKAVEQRSGIKHASPQVIVFRDGKPAWDASHGKIRADRVSEAVTKAQ